MFLRLPAGSARMLWGDVRPFQLAHLIVAGSQVVSLAERGVLESRRAGRGGAGRSSLWWRLCRGHGVRRFGVGAQRQREAAVRELGGHFA